MPWSRERCVPVWIPMQANRRRLRDGRYSGFNGRPIRPIESFSSSDAESEIPVDSALGHSSKTVSLLQLIEETLHIDNLRMEEASPRELKRLLQELEVSIQRVKAALVAMDRGLPS
jgi:hypothetical protein